MKRTSFLFVIIALAIYFPAQSLMARAPADCTLPSKPIESSDFSNRCVLYGIVRNCLNPSSSNYCTACNRPVAEAPCSVKDECLRTEIWEKNSSFVAMKDGFKSCGCSKDFVHGLVLPLGPVTGVEDPRTISNPKLVGIWEFAWGVGQKKISEPNEIILTANAFDQRSQDQLHIHIVRMAPDIRSKVLALKLGAFQAQEIVGHVRGVAVKIKSLKEVWSTAKSAARGAGFADYGIAVLKNGDNYIVVSTDGSHKEDFSPERGLAMFQCLERRSLKK
jgi:CDP-diacylglycerol pyrophosphatase